MAVVEHRRSAWHRSEWRCQDQYCVRHRGAASKCEHKQTWHTLVRCRKRDCRGCGRWWSADQRTKIFRNLEAYVGATALVTVTAPGQDRLPYGEDGERCLPGPLRAWNYMAPKKWRSLHRVASQRAKRAANGERWCVLAKVWQEQRRGALHVHLVVPMATPAQRAASRVYADALHENRGAHDFGFVDRKLVVRAPEKAAGYISRYVSRELAVCRELPGHVVDVARVLTAQTGVTVRTLRAARASFARGAARLDSEAPTPQPCWEQLTLTSPCGAETVGRAAGRSPPGSELGEVSYGSQGT